MAKQNDVVTTDLTQFLQGVVPVDIELVTVRVAGQAPSRKVTVIIGKVGGLTLDEVADTTRVINQALDAVADTEDDPVPGGYTLEVTTPGLNWPLTTQADFARVGEHKVHISTTSGDVWVGQVVTAEDAHVTIQTDSGPVTVEYTAIKKATQALPF